MPPIIAAFGAVMTIGVIEGMAITKGILAKYGDTLHAPEMTGMIEKAFDTTKTGITSADLLLPLIGAGFASALTYKYAHEIRYGGPFTGTIKKHFNSLFSPLRNKFGKAVAAPVIATGNMMNKFTAKMDRVVQEWMPGIAALPIFLMTSSAIAESGAKTIGQFGPFYGGLALALGAASITINHGNKTRRIFTKRYVEITTCHRHGLWLGLKCHDHARK